MNSPYRVHPASPSSAAPAVGNTIPFPAAQAKPKAPEPSNKLQILIKLEGDIRKLPSVAALAFHAVNDARELIAFDQAYFFRANNRGEFHLEAATGLATVDVNAPMVQALSTAIRSIAEKSKPASLDLPKVMHSQTYPFAHGLWMPMQDRRQKTYCGLVLARSEAFTDADRTIITRLVGAYAHAALALNPPSLLRSLSLPRWALYGIPISALLMAVIPVPLTALAPVEVIALEPQVISAPIDGAIVEIPVSPNTIVAEGTVLFRLDSTVQQAEVAIARQKVAVADSRLATARNGAFTDKDMKRSLAVAEKELQLAKAELDYRISLLLKTEVKASRDGLLVFSGKSDWIGRPVRVGEKVMEIADPARVQYNIELAVSDAIVLQEGARARVFLDADPLSPKDAIISEMSYHAVEGRDGSMSYLIKALPPENEAAQRIGLRGTAQVSGDDVPLGFYLLRRPIAALRQYFGI